MGIVPFGGIVGVVSMGAPCGMSGCGLIGGGGYPWALAPSANVTSHSNSPSATKLQRRREIGSPSGPFDLWLKAAVSGSTAL
jgi:hypothetical protein